MAAGAGDSGPARPSGEPDASARGPLPSDRLPGSRAGPGSRMTPTATPRATPNITPRATPTAEATAGGTAVPLYGPDRAPGGAPEREAVDAARDHLARTRGVPPGGVTVISSRRTEVPVADPCDGSERGPGGLTVGVEVVLEVDGDHLTRYVAAGGLLHACPERRDRRPLPLPRSSPRDRHGAGAGPSPVRLP